MFRVGLLAVLRSKSHGGLAIGVMVTASHNPEQDNGVKLVEPMGSMLAAQWESYAIEMANTTDILKQVESIISAENIDISIPAIVVVGRDTRPSGAALVQSLTDGINALGGKTQDFGLLSTPQLHYLTRCINTAGTPDAYGTPTTGGYYDKLSAAYIKIVVP